MEEIQTVEKMVAEPVVKRVVPQAGLVGDTTTVEEWVPVFGSWLFSLTDKEMADKCAAKNYTAVQCRAWCIAIDQYMEECRRPGEQWRIAPLARWGRVIVADLKVKCLTEPFPVVPVEKKRFFKQSGRTS